MRCGRRFGKAFLRGGLGRGHLTEGWLCERARAQARLTAHERDPSREQRDAEHGQRGEQRSPAVTGRPRLAPARGTGNVAHYAPLTNGRRRDPRLAELRRPRPGRGRRTGMRRASTDGSPSRLSPCAVLRSLDFLPDRRRRRGARPCRRRPRSCDPWVRLVSVSRGRLRVRRLGRLRERRGRSLGGWRLHLGLRLGRRRLLRCAPGRQERQRVDVAVRVRGQADAQIDVRLGPLGLAARADRADDVALGDLGSDRDPDRAEMDERDRVPVLGTDRQAEPLLWKPAGEGDDSGRCGTDVRTGRGADVDPAVLAAGVRIPIGDERPEHRPVDRPGPGRGPGREHESGEESGDERVA
jgi:hypothetical protein